jgi:hypothetical protein
MESLTKPAIDVVFGQGMTPSVPAALTAENLERLKSSPTWNAIQSKVYVVPFSPMIEDLIPRCVKDLTNPITRCEHSDFEWPANIVFDWAWGARIAGAFGREAYQEDAASSDFVQYMSRKRSQEAISKE